MYRRNIVGISALVVGLAMVPGGAGAQQKSIKDQVVGAWTLLLADNVKDDGTHVPGYGPNPEGLLVFTADEAGKAITFRIAASSFPNWDGTVQKRPLTAITDEVLAWNTLAPSAAGYVRAEVAWKKAK